METASDRLHRAGVARVRSGQATEVASYLAGALGGTRTPNLLIRRSGQVAQDRPSMVAGWTYIPGLSTCVGCCSAAWLQCWLQSRRNAADPRPSAFQAGHIPKSPYNVRASGAVVGRRCLPLVVAVAVTVAVSSAQVVRGQADPDPQGLSVLEDRKRGRPLTGPHHLIQRGMERPVQVRCCLPESLAADRGIEFIL